MFEFVDCANDLRDMQIARPVQTASGIWLSAAKFKNRVLQSSTVESGTAIEATLAAMEVATKMQQIVRRKK